MKSTMIALSMLLFAGCAPLRWVNQWPQRTAKANEELRENAGMQRVEYVAFDRYMQTEALPEVVSRPSRTYKEIGKFTAYDGGDFAESYETLLGYARKRAAMDGADAVTDVQMGNVAVGEAGSVQTFYTGDANYQTQTRFRRVVRGTAIKYIGGN